MIRAAGPDDLAAIDDLERTAFGSGAWSRGLLEEGLSGRIPGACYVVSETAARVVGYAVASLVADVAELQRVAVTPGHRRTGVASALLDHVLGEARTHGADRLLLEVREDNQGALAFYARWGFRELDRRPRYYPDGTTAVVLEKDLTT